MASCPLPKDNCTDRIRLLLASFLQARNERHFRSAEWRVTGQGLSTVGTSQRSAGLTLYRLSALDRKQQTARVYAGGMNLNDKMIVQTSSERELFPTLVEC